MTLRQLQQVAITYVTRPSVWGWLLFVFYLLILSLLFADIDSSDIRTNAAGLIDSALPVLFLALIPFAACRMHAFGWQFSHPRATLTPGFAGPHLAILAGVGVASLVIAPTLVAQAADISPWFTLALSAGATLLFTQSWALSFAWLPLMLGVHTAKNWKSDLIEPWLLAEGYRTHVLAAVTVCSWGMIVRSTLKTASAREEEGAATPPVWEATDSRSARPFRQAKAIRSQAVFDNVESAMTSQFLDRAICKRRHSRDWKRLRTALYPPFALALRKGLQSLFVMAIAFAVVLWPRWNSFQVDDETLSTAVHVLAYLSLAAALSPAITLANRLPQISVERLLPMSNRTYVDALLINSAITAALIWSISHAIAIAVTLAMAARSFAPPTAGTLATYSLLSSAGVLFAFGLAINCALLPNFVTVLITLILSLASTVGLVSYWLELRPHESSGLAILIAFAIAIAGGTLVLRARVAWRDKELG